jgi:hypothetical protein
MAKGKTNSMRLNGPFSMRPLCAARGRCGAFAVALGLTAACAWGGVATPLYVGNVVPAKDQNGQPLSGSPDPAPAELCSRVELRTAASGILPPAADGAPHPANPLYSADSVTGMGRNAAEPDSGLFVISFSERPATGTKLFARAYNAPTVAEASFYTDTYVGSAPEKNSSLVLTFGATLPLDTGDADGDGLDNSWEKSLGTDDRLTGDYDGDGMGDLDEHYAGTDLKDPNSLLAFRNIQREATATRPVRVRWQSVPGKSYQLEFVPELLGAQIYIPVDAVVTAAEGEFEMEQLVDVPDETTAGSFRVRLVTKTSETEP